MFFLALVLDPADRPERKAKLAISASILHGDRYSGRAQSPVKKAPGTSAVSTPETGNDLPVDLRRTLDGEDG